MTQLWQHCLIRHHLYDFDFDFCINYGGTDIEKHRSKLHQCYPTNAKPNFFLNIKFFIQNKYATEELDTKGMHEKDTKSETCKPE